MMLKILIALCLIVTFSYVDITLYKFMKGNKDVTITMVACMLPFIGILLLMEIFALLVLWSL